MIAPAPPQDATLLLPRPFHGPFRSFTERTHMRFRATTFLFATLLLHTFRAPAQCSIFSSDGYTMEVLLSLTEVVPTAPNCPNGYNYNVRLAYDITFSGSNIPAGMWTLQGRLYCGGNAHFFDLPNNGGSGQVLSQSNVWRGVADCHTATVGSLECATVILEVQGPGIPWQNVPCNATILPVELVSTTATAGPEGVRVEWVTASETDNSHFTVERSMDALHFEPVGLVPGAGTSSQLHHYGMVDTSPYTGTSYYRVRQTDMDGSSQMGPIVAVKVDAPVVVRIHPNPNAGRELVLSGDVQDTWLQVMDAAGKTVSGHTLTGQHLTLPELAPGLYMLRFQRGQTTVQHVRYMQQ